MHRGLLLGAFAVLTHGRHLAADVVLEELPGVPEGWTHLRGAADDQILRLRIALEQPNKDLFEKTLYDVSTPQHPMYGKHLKKDELRAMVKPLQESTDAVLNWLRDAGIPGETIRDDGDWINLVTTAGQANEMLNTTFGIFAYADGVERIRALRYSVPEEIVRHITMVAPIVRFGQIRRQRSLVLDEVAASETFQAAEIPSTELNITACNATMTPECLRALYKVGDYRSEPTERSLFGVCGYLEVSDPRQSRFPKAVASRPMDHHWNDSPGPRVKKILTSAAMGSVWHARALHRSVRSVRQRRQLQRGADQWRREHRGGH